MGAIDKLKHYRTLWALVLPHVTMPQPEDVAQWMDYSHDAVEAAILRAAKRFARPRIGEKFYPEQAYRYTTGTARLIDGQTKARQ